MPDLPSICLSISRWLAGSLAHLLGLLGCYSPDSPGGVPVPDPVLVAVVDRGSWVVGRGLGGVGERERVRWVVRWGRGENGWQAGWQRR